MVKRARSNPLALAVLICLAERPMHPYEIATTLRQRHKHESVRLNYGSLYAVVGSLERRGLIAPRETEREGRLPERTIYELTDPGRVEALDWLTEMVSVPVKEYPEFEAALSFLPALPPDDVVTLLHERAQGLERNVAQLRATQELVRDHQLPRLLWIESQFHLELTEAELAFVRALAQDIEQGSLEGLPWWRAIHEDPGDPPPPAPHLPFRLDEERSAAIGTEAITTRRTSS
jgi:DNA-binding PadR family transcriptional regulator